MKCRYKVPVTISSRSQKHVFHLADQATMVKYLRSVCDKEAINISDDALELLYKHGGGSFRDTLSLLDQISIIEHDNDITKDDIIKALGLPDDTLISQLLDAYHGQDPSQIRNILGQLYNASVNATTIASSLIELIVQGMKPEDIPLLNKLILNENNNAIAQCKDLVAQYKALEPSGYKVFVIPTDTGFRKAQTTSVPVQSIAGSKKETLDALSEIAQALK